MPSAPKAMIVKADFVIILNILQAVTENRFPSEYRSDAGRIAELLRSQLVG